jgi:hypothetical protein
MVWQRNSSKQQRPAPRRRAAEAVRRVDIPAGDTAVRGAKAGRVVAGMAARGVMAAALAAPAAVREGHAGANGNISARRKFASSASRRWT